jgi:hypothetical protein
MTPALADPVVAVTVKTAARPRRAARQPSGATATLLAGDEAAACGTAAAGLSPTTLEFTPAMWSGVVVCALVGGAGCGGLGVVMVLFLIV